MQNIRDQRKSNSMEIIETKREPQTRTAYTFTRSKLLWQQARQLIAGGTQGTRQPCYPEYPAYIKRAKGCRMWDVDDNESLVLLATLNRLTGNDQLQSKSKLIKSLTKCIDIKELAKQLPDNKKAIERLTSLVQKDYIYPDKKPLSLGPMVFFLDDEQTELIDLALAKAGQNTPEGTRAQKKAAAFVKISKAYLLQPAG